MLAHSRRTAETSGRSFLDSLKPQENLRLAALLLFVAAMSLTHTTRERRPQIETREDACRHTALAAELRQRTDDLLSRLRWRDPAVAEISFLEDLATERVPDVMLHGERVARYAQAVAREWALDGETARLLRTAARFHDIGKLAMPGTLLTKPSPLTPGEWTVLRRHVDVGAEILASTKTLAELAPIVIASHEWFNGGGYPHGIAGAIIPLTSRIIAVVDAYDSATLHRHGRARIDAAEAMTDLRRGSGSQFDPDILDTFLGIIGRH